MATDLRNFSGVELIEHRAGPAAPLEHPTGRRTGAGARAARARRRGSPLGANVTPMAVVPRPRGGRAKSWRWSARRRCVLVVVRPGGACPRAAFARARRDRAGAGRPRGGESARSASAPMPRASAAPRLRRATDRPDAAADESERCKPPTPPPGAANAVPRRQARCRRGLRRPPPRRPRGHRGSRGRDAAAPVAKPTGRMAFAVTPWGEVHVDGRKRGVRAAAAGAARRARQARRRDPQLHLPTVHARPSRSPPTASCASSTSSNETHAQTDRGHRGGTFALLRRPAPRRQRAGVAPGTGAHAGATPPGAVPAPPPPPPPRHRRPPPHRSWTPA